MYAEKHLHFTYFPFSTENKIGYLLITSNILQIIASKRILYIRKILFMKDARSLSQVIITR